MSSSSVDPDIVNDTNDCGDDENAKQKAEKLKEEANAFFKGTGSMIFAILKFLP